MNGEWQTTKRGFLLKEGWGWAPLLVALWAGCGSGAEGPPELRQRQAPIAIIDGSVLVQVGETFTLDGSASYDPDGGSIQRYEWLIDDARVQTEPQLRYAFSVPGSHRVRLIVQDDEFVFATTEVSLRVESDTPIDTTPPPAPSVLEATLVDCTQVAFAWAVSTDEEGGSGFAGYRIYRLEGTEWRLIGELTQPRMGDVGLEAQTTYTYSVTAVDLAGNESERSDVLVVTTASCAPNEPPTANAGINKYTFLPNNAISLVGSGQDSDGAIASYEWIKMDGPMSYQFDTFTEPSATVSLLQEGTYTFRLVVTDDEGATAFDDMKVYVAGGPDIPVAWASHSGSTIIVGTVLTLSGADSYGISGGIAAWDWDFGDGQSDSGRTVNHFFGNVRIHDVTLTVTDGDGNTDSVTTRITVIPEAPGMLSPTAEARCDLGNVVVDLSWNADPLRSTYRIERRMEGATVYQHVDFAAGPSFSDTSPLAALTAEYRVQAWSATHGYTELESTGLVGPNPCD